MDGVNRTLYIPLYGKAAVSRKVKVNGAALRPAGTKGRLILCY